MAISRKKPTSSVRDRMKELMEPIDQQIMMTDDREEMLMIACVMLARSKEILINELGIRATVDVISSSINDIR